MLEHEGIGGLSGDKPRPMRGRAGSTGTDLDTPSHLDPKEALDALLQQLTKFHLVLQKHGLDPEIISQIFRQVPGIPFPCSIKSLFWVHLIYFL